MSVCGQRHTDGHPCNTGGICLAAAATCGGKSNLSQLLKLTYNKQHSHYT